METFVRRGTWQPEGPIQVTVQGWAKHPESRGDHEPPEHDGHLAGSGWPRQDAGLVPAEPSFPPPATSPPPSPGRRPGPRLVFASCLRGEVDLLLVLPPWLAWLLLPGGLIP